MITLLCAFLAACLGEFLIACMICSIMNCVANRKEKYMDLLFVVHPRTPCEHRIPIGIKYGFNPNGKYMAREYEGISMHGRHRLKRGVAALTETIREEHR